MVQYADKYQEAVSAMSRLITGWDLKGHTISFDGPHHPLSNSKPRPAGLLLCDIHPPLVLPRQLVMPLVPPLALVWDQVRPFFLFFLTPQPHHRLCAQKWQF